MAYTDLDFGLVSLAHATQFWLGPICQKDRPLSIQWNVGKNEEAQFNLLYFRKSQTWLQLEYELWLPFDMYGRTSQPSQTYTIVLSVTTRFP